MPGIKISKAPENNSYAASSVHLKLRRELKEDYMEAGEARQGLIYRIVNKIICFFEDGYGLFERCINLDAQKQCGQVSYRPQTGSSLQSWGLETPVS